MRLLLGCITVSLLFAVSVPEAKATQENRRGELLALNDDASVEVNGEIIPIPLLPHMPGASEESTETLPPLQELDREARQQERVDRRMESPPKTRTHVSEQAVPVPTSEQVSPVHGSAPARLDGRLQGTTRSPLPPTGAGTGILVFSALGALFLTCHKYSFLL